MQPLKLGMIALNLADSSRDSGAEKSVALTPAGSAGTTHSPYLDKLGDPRGFGPGQGSLSSGWRGAA